MYTKEEAHKLIDYYQKQLKGWEFRMLFIIQPDETIVGITPKENTLYDIQGKDVIDYMRLSDICDKFNLLHPDVVLEKLV